MNALITHVILKPPVTDDTALLGLYRNLFDAMQIPNGLEMFSPLTTFQHPIPESQDQILKDFNITFHLLKNLQEEKGIKLEIKDTRVGANNVTFVISKTSDLNIILP